MKLSVRALVIACAILWGGAVLLTSVINMAAPAYGAEFLRVVSSIYPGFHASRTFADVIVGTVYALVDGAGCGLFFGLLYNAFATEWTPVRVMK